MAALPLHQLMTEERLDALQKIFKVLSNRVVALTDHLHPLPVTEVVDIEIQDEMSERSLSPAPSEVRNQDCASQQDGESPSGDRIAAPATLGDPIPKVWQRWLAAALPRDLDPALVDFIRVLWDSAEREQQMLSATSKFPRPEVSCLVLPEQNPEMKALVWASTKCPGDVEEKASSLVRDRFLRDLQSRTRAAIGCSHGGQ